MTAKAKAKYEVADDVAVLILEATQAIPLDVVGPAFEDTVEALSALRSDLDLDNQERSGPYVLSDGSRELALRALSEIKIPVTHPNWITLTEVLVKARAQLGVVE